MRLRRASKREADRTPRSAADYPRVFDQLSPDELHADPKELTDEALSEALFRPRSRSHHFLGFYSHHGGRLAMERYGFFKLLRQKGFDPQLKAELTDPQRQQLLVYDGTEDPEHLLIKLEAGFRDLELPHGESCRMLFIDWLMMQDPRRSFSAERPRLPDQRHPGLGLFLYFGHLLKLMAVRLHCDGLIPPGSSEPPGAPGPRPPSATPPSASALPRSRLNDPQVDPAQLRRERNNPQGIHQPPRRERNDPQVDPVRSRREPNGPQVDPVQPRRGPNDPQVDPVQLRRGPNDPQVEHLQPCGRPDDPQSAAVQPRERPMTLNQPLCNRAEGQMTLIHAICTLQSLKMSCGSQALDKNSSAGLEFKR